MDYADYAQRQADQFMQRLEEVYGAKPAEQLEEDHALSSELQAVLNNVYIAGRALDNLISNRRNLMQRSEVGVLGKMASELNSMAVKLRKSFGLR